MRPVIEITGKQKPVLILIIIILIILLNNLSSRQDYIDLDKNMSSIYTDRLMPANYLFQINDHLYQKRLIIQEQNLPVNKTANLLAMHNAAIDELIKEYETTYLTKAEREQWSFFKKSIATYNNTEANTNLNLTLLKNSFDESMQALNKLNTIQITEGKQIQTTSKAIIGGSMIGSYLEITLIFILAMTIFTLIRKTYTDNKDQFLPVAKEHLYN